MSTDLDTQHGSETAGHELRDVSFRPVVAAAFGLTVVIGLVLLAMWLLFGDLAARAARSTPAANPLATQSARELPPIPRLQTAPIDDLRRLRDAEDTLLKTYEWVNADKGIVRIPIERAMDLLAARGIHDSPEALP
jgi:hypothetical protein